MSKKTSGSVPQNTSSVQDAMKDSAHQIWLAGLGAFQQAQEQGSKMFDLLVQEGLAMQRKTQTAATEKLSEASTRMNQMAEELGNRASDQWDRLEHLFELRVAHALHRLGMPSSREVQALHERVADLEKKQPAKKPSARAAATATKTAPTKKKPAAGPRTAARKKTG